MLAHPAKLWLIDTDLDEDTGYGTKMSPRNKTVTLLEPQHHVVNPANPGGALNDGVEDWNGETWFFGLGRFWDLFD